MEALSASINGYGGERPARSFVLTFKDETHFSRLPVVAILLLSVPYGSPPVIMRLISFIVLVIGCALCMTIADPARGQHPSFLRYQLLYAHDMDLAVANTPVLLADSTEEYSTGALYLGGVLGWAAGFAGGAYAGYWFLDRPAGEIHVPAGTALGALAGSAVGTPLGVHVFNGARGNYLLGLLGSSAISFGTAYFLIQYERPVDYRWLAAGMAAAQIVVSVSIETATSD